MRANRGVEGVNRNVEGANGDAPDFSTIITQQLQNLLPVMLAQVSNRGNVGNQNGNVVNDNIQENIGNDGGSNRAKDYTEGSADFWCMTDEAVRNGSIKKVEKRGNVGEPSKDKNSRDDNKRTRTRNAFVTTVNLVRRENMAKDCRGVPRNMNLVNARNPTIRACYQCGSTDHVRPACPRLNRARGPEENCLEPSDLGFKYEIEIASGQLVEIDKVIKDCKLEIEGHVFDIDLIPFGHGSFDVIIGMDWLSNYKAKIIFHEKGVRIPLPDGKVLRVVGESLDEKARLLMSAKSSDKKQEEVVVVRDFPEVFPDDLSGLPPIREIEFRIELIPGATLVAKTPYCLAPSELEELSG
ncbi:putative reverse transcriptase domain-containing protein [Tanacetum coccineum]|uniref:Reverse transcriptase domain-containing protein n=1 Tax=Tanacetum coccineum TaxID=301880 RepID=A0ABQ5FZ08_9ASTR